MLVQTLDRLLDRFQHVLDVFVVQRNIGDRFLIVLLNDPVGRMDELRGGVF